MHIIPNKELAIANIALDDPDLKIFTNSSGMNGKISASAVLYRDNRCKSSLCYQLRSISHHTVYEGEATIILLATNLILKETHVRSAIIYIDSKALTLATLLTSPTPGHYIIDSFHSTIYNIHKKLPRLAIQIKWVPTHKNVKGNEAANHLAKSAITNGSSATTKLPKLLTSSLPYSKSAAKQDHRSQTQAKIQCLWIQSKHYPHMKYTDPRSPSPDYVVYISSLPRKLASLITQLHTGHIPLNKYLFCISKSPTPICPACQQSNKTVQHYILHCPAYHPFIHTL